MGAKILYTIGDLFGKCIFIKELDKKVYRMGLFICHCGNEFETSLPHLKNGNITECSICAKKTKTNTLIKRNTTHGMRYLAENSIWVDMRRRCQDEKRDDYKYYGGKGIKVCERWAKSFENFYSDMGPRPSNKHSIERKDSMADYGPSNCFWAIHKVQMRNTSRSRYITHNGTTKLLADWAAEIGILPRTLHSRIFRQKWAIERALGQSIAVSKNDKQPFIRHAFGVIN